jgi:leucyl aminopeptidase
MEISFGIGDPLRGAADAAIVPVSAGDDEMVLSDLAAVADAALEGELARLARESRFLGAVGTAMVVPTLGRLGARRLVLTGTGPPASFDRQTVRTAWGAAAAAAREAGASSIVSPLPPDNGSLAVGSALASATEGARLALYRFDKYLSEKPAKNVTGIRFLGDGIDADAGTRAIARGDAVAAGVALARDLVNEPASVLTPEAMVESARDVAAASGLEVAVLGPTELEEVGAGAITAVGRGSVHEPRLIRLRYRPTEAGSKASDEPKSRRTDRLVGLVGKCITFDTGGYSIKTADGMAEMKGDMAGGAAVLGAMSALRALACPLAVDATICAAENMISGTAFRPGDVLTAMNGVTVEILSTDAEGRLVLADGLVDAARRGATELIDLATLTGAAVVALGEGTTALFASDDALAEQLGIAAAAAGERAWRMPLVPELNEKIKGDVADVKNSGGRGGGAITAALFLQRFTGGLPWAHFDIAASARSARSGPLGPKGASGVGVRTLLAYLTELDA